MRAGFRPHAWPPPRAAAKIAPWLGSTTNRQRSPDGSTARSPADGPARAPQVWRCSRATPRTAASGGSRWTRRRVAAARPARPRMPASAIAIDLGPDDLPAYVRALNLVSNAAGRAAFPERAALSQIDRRGRARNLRRRPGASDAAGRGRRRDLVVPGRAGRGRETGDALSQRRGRASADSRGRHAPARPRMYRRVDRIRRAAVSMGDGGFSRDRIGERRARHRPRARSRRNSTISRRGSAVLRACCRIATTTATIFSCKTIMRECASG